MSNPEVADEDKLREIARRTAGDIFNKHSIEEVGIALPIIVAVVALHTQNPLDFLSELFGLSSRLVLKKHFQHPSGHIYG